MKKNIFIIVLIFSIKSIAQAPVIEWSKTMNSILSGNSLARATIQNSTTDANGNIYSVGVFTGTLDFNIGTDIYNLTANAQLDSFILKYDASGNFVWVKQLTGISGYIECKNIAIDINGAIYYTGIFSYNIDLDPSSNTFSLTSTSSGNSQGFIGKLNADGDFLWGKFLEGIGAIFVEDIVVKNNEVIVSGNYNITIDFDPSSNVQARTAIGSFDNFILKLASDGSFIWANTFGGNDNDILNDLKVDNFGNIYTLGRFTTTVDFDQTETSTLLTSNGAYDGFISKIDSSGSLIWVKQIGGNLTDIIHEVEIDSNNELIIVGNFQETVSFDNANTITSNGASDLFIEKLDTNGNLIWLKTFGSSGFDSFGSFELDANNNIYFLGFLSTDLDVDPSSDTFIITHNAALTNGDSYFLKLNNEGNFNWASSFDSTIGGKISIVNSSLYLAGTCFGDGDFDLINNTNVFNISEYGGSFIAKYNLPSLNNINFDFVNNLKLYPNPTSGNFYIEIEENLIGAKVTVYNVLGQKVKNFSLENVSTNQNLEAGIYILEIEKEGNKTSKKLFVN